MIYHLVDLKVTSDQQTLFKYYYNGLIHYLRILIVDKYVIVQSESANNVSFTSFGVQDMQL